MVVKHPDCVVKGYRTINTVPSMFTKASVPNDSKICCMVVHRFSSMVAAGAPIHAFLEFF